MIQDSTSSPLKMIDELLVSVRVRSKFILVFNVPADAFDELNRKFDIGPDPNWKRFHLPALWYGSHIILREDAAPTQDRRPILTDIIEK